MNELTGTGVSKQRPQGEREVVAGRLKRNEG